MKVFTANEALQHSTVLMFAFGCLKPFWKASFGSNYTLLFTQRFLTFRCVQYVKIKDTDDVLPVKDAAIPVMVIIPLNFARFTLPRHGNR